MFNYHNFMKFRFRKKSVKTKTLVHIGQHKTGTTSIQHYLQNNKRYFMKRGLYIPDGLAGFKEASHFLLNVTSLKEGRYSPMKDKLIEEKPNIFWSNIEAKIRDSVRYHYMKAKKTGCSQVIWSNEGLYLLNTEEEYNKLKEYFLPYSSEIEIICCFRDVESFKNSYRIQLHKMGMEESNDRDSYKYLKDDSWLFCYSKKKKLLESVFDRCTYFNYSSKDNITKFMRIIGHNNGPEPGEYRFNTSR